MVNLESYRPSPERVWIRYRPRNWPAASGVWTDWARLLLGQPGRRGSHLPRSPLKAVSDVVYLPPVETALESRRHELAREWAAAGTPVVLQSLVGRPALGAEGVTELWDLLPWIVHGGGSEALGLPEGASAVWPLVAGVTDAPETLQTGLEQLQRAGVSTVHPLVLELSAVVKRRLVGDLDEEAFDRLFHGPSPDERRFAGLATQFGIRPFLTRPLPGANPRLALRRRCAGELRLAAHLTRRLGRADTEEQSLLRAARWIDRENHDLAALVEDGNLQIVDWLDERSRTVVESVVRDGRSPWVVDLAAELASSGG